MLERDTRQIFVIAAEATAAAHSLFQVREARYPLPVNGRGCNKVVFPFNNIPDEKYPDSVVVMKRIEIICNSKNSRNINNHTEPMIILVFLPISKETSISNI